MEKFSGYPKKPTVGIVMRTKDRTVLLRRALESVKNQTYPHWQLVIVNDGGDPAPVEKLRAAIFTDDPRVQVVHHVKSKGMEAASNAGISLLNTDLGLIHNDDDSLAPEMLSIATQALVEINRKHPSVRGVATRVCAVFETVQGNNIRITHMETWPGNQDHALQSGLVSLSKMIVKNQFPPICFLFDISICKTLGMFNESLPVLGEWDFHLRYCINHDIWIHPEMLSFYHHRPNASGSLANTIVADRNTHEAVNTKVRNAWIRDGLNGEGPSAPLAVLLREHADSVGFLHWTIWELSRKIENLQMGGNSKPQKSSKKTKMGQYLSDLNKKRKAWTRGRV